MPCGAAAKRAQASSRSNFVQDSHLQLNKNEQTYLYRGPIDLEAYRKSEKEVYIAAIELLQAFKSHLSTTYRAYISKRMIEARIFQDSTSSIYIPLSEEAWRPVKTPKIEHFMKMLLGTESLTKILR